MRNRRTFGSRRGIGAPLALAAIGAFVWMGMAAPARADSNFERGFEDQMGRILAYEAVNLGKHILFEGVVHPATYGHTPAHGPGYAYETRPHPTQVQVHYTRNEVRYPGYRRVPQHTHEHGARPWRFDRHDRGNHYGHDRGHAKWKRDRHDWDRGHRHDRHCHH